MIMVMMIIIKEREAKPTSRNKQAMTKNKLSRKARNKGF